MKNSPERFIDNKAFPRVIKKITKGMGNIPWCLIGGRAVEVWTNPPQTPDLDILYDANELDGVAVVDRLEAVGISLNENYREGDIIFMLDRKEKVEVDVLPTYDPLNVTMIRAAKPIVIQGVSTPVVSPENLVILKAQILADAEAGSVAREPDKLERDAASIRTLGLRRDLDRFYIGRTLKREGWDDEIKILKRLGVLK